MAGGGEKEKIKVLLADDHTMFRQGIKEMLSTDARIAVVGEAENGEKAVALAGELQPDVVLLDVEMPVMGARGTMEPVLKVSPRSKIIILTMYSDPRLVRELVGMGAVGYLVKSATIEELLAAVRNAAESPVGPGENVMIVMPPEVIDDPRREFDHLSEREQEVLLMVARGLSNRQIATSLYLSESTVKRHLANIYPKLEVSSRGEAVSKAMQEGWISSRDITSAGNEKT